jgi:hypothetical protein
MAKCGERDCKETATTGWEHHVYSTSATTDPKIIDKWHTLWCDQHPTSIQYPGRWLSKKEIDKL